MKDMLQKGGNHDINIVEFEIREHAAKLHNFNNDLQKKYGEKIKYDSVPTMFKINGGGKIEYYQGEREPTIMKNWVLGNNKINGGRRKNKKRTRSGTRSGTRKNRVVKNYSYKKLKIKNMKT
jgi:hypothetical protein